MCFIYWNLTFFFLFTCNIYRKKILQTIELLQDPHLLDASRTYNGDVSFGALTPFLFQFHFRFNVVYHMSLGPLGKINWYHRYYSNLCLQLGFLILLLPQLLWHQLQIMQFWLMPFFSYLQDWKCSWEISRPTHCHGNQFSGSCKLFMQF